MSLKAGGTGLNLTNASHVIHFDRWWNPAVENQATDRAFRIGQKKNVFVYKFITTGTIEEKIDEFELRQLAIDEARLRLLKLYGVGPETARILLTEALHHYDIFDHVAPWQQKIYSRLLFGRKLVSPEKIIQYVKNKWGKWVNLAALYIWEDIFWQRKQGKKIPWLEKEIRL